MLSLYVVNLNNAADLNCKLLLVPGDLAALVFKWTLRNF